MMTKKFAMRLSQCLCALLLIVSALAARAEAGAADNAEAFMRTLIQTVSANLDKLYKDKRIEDRAAIEQLIRNDILPHIDQTRLTQRVFRQYWGQLTKANRQGEAQERVVNAVVRTYAVALSGYSGDTLTLINVNEQGARTTAKSRLRRPNGQTIQLDFSLANKDGQWLINDMAVDGIVVSLTLFNAVKSVWDQQGMDAALESIGSVDLNKPQEQKQPSQETKQQSQETKQQSREQKQQ